MFGYIVPFVCEMKVHEYETFSAYYCGLCKELKRAYKKSIALNYDCTFLYILADSLSGEMPNAQVCKCFLHPIRKRVEVSGKGLSYAADINILMAYSKIADDYLDGGKKLSSFLRLAMFKRAYKKAAARVPEIAKLAKDMADELHVLEENNSANTDALAHTYACLFGKVAEGINPLYSHILYDLGYHLGRWVYLIDAYDDIEKDKKNGEYNVFVNKYGDKSKEEIRKEVEFTLHYTLSQASKAIDRLEFTHNGAILKNIVKLGLREQTKKILSEGKTDEPIRDFRRY